MIDTILNEVINNPMDYDKIFDESFSYLPNVEEVDINFIITVRDRLSFASPMYNSFLKASKNSTLKILYTVVEHSINRDHYDFCLANKINYIWIKANPNELFNKCLAYNMAALFTNKTKNYIFHDIDILVQSDFFNKLGENIENKKCNAIQCFTGRRVICCKPTLTEKIINGLVSPDEISMLSPEITIPKSGAPGGSIFVSRDLFFRVGGYDAELFLGYAPEDGFFWDKIDTVDKMEVSDNPPIELYHMHHKPSINDNPHYRHMISLITILYGCSFDDKIKLINFKEELIKKYK